MCWNEYASFVYSQRFWIWLHSQFVQMAYSQKWLWFWEIWFIFMFHPVMISDCLGLSLCPADGVFTMIIHALLMHTPARQVDDYHLLSGMQLQVARSTSMVLERLSCISDTNEGKICFQGPSLTRRPPVWVFQMSEGFSASKFGSLFKKGDPLDHPSSWSISNLDNNISYPLVI